MNHKFIAAKYYFKRPNTPYFLYKNIWKEHTTTLLHGPREIDKTMFALSIADEIARKGREVLYVNASDNLEGLNSDRENLYIFNPEFESIDDKSDYADLIFEAIEQAVRTTSIRTFVIDSVSRIAALSFGRNSSPTYVLKRLVALQVKCKLSFLVIANDTTKSAVNALLALCGSDMYLRPEPNLKTQPQPTTPQSVNSFHVRTRNRLPLVDGDMIWQLCRGVKSDLPPFPVCRPEM